MILIIFIDPVNCYHDKNSKPIEKFHEFIKVYLSQRTSLEARYQQTKKNDSKNDSFQFLLYIWN